MAKRRCEWPGCDREATIEIALLYLGDAVSCDEHELQFFELNAQLRGRRHQPRN